MSAIKQSEKHVEAMLKAATEQCGGTAVKMALTGARGFPDRLLLLPGRVVFVEVKGTGGKPDPMQEVWKRKIEALGLEWYLLDHTDDINAILRGPEALVVEPEYAPAATSLILDQPTMEKYGWHTQNGFADEPSGWMFEGGEDAYYEALKNWEALGVDPDLCTECTFDTENGYMENCPRCGGA
jgi:hypothetical protein